MKLLDLHIDGFGKFHDRDLSFEDGLNVVYGKNETGKSTIHTFIRCMLFGMERGRGRASKNDCYTRSAPWENKGAYGGTLRVEHEGTIYRIERNFAKDIKSLTIVDETLGKAVDPPKPLLDEILGGLTETTYSNTISIGQLKSATDSGMVSELRNYIANMNTSGNMALNISKASAYLKNRRKEFERQLVPEAARSYTALLGEIRSIEKEIAAPEYENQLKTYQNMRSQVGVQLTEKQAEREALLQKIAAGRQVLAGAQFTDEASIRSYRQETAATYEEYLTAKTSGEKKSRRILAFFCILLAIGCGFLSGIAYFSAGPLELALHLDRRTAFDWMLPLLAPSFSPEHFIMLAGAGAVCAVLLLTAGIGLVLKGKRLKKEAAMSGKVLQEIFSRHLGDSTVSEDAKKAFDGRMEEYIRLSQTLTRSESSVAEQADQINSLKEQQASCDTAISKQQRMQWELEKKLDHLAHCKDQAESLKRILSENEQVREELAAIDLALETMTELSSSIRDSFGLYLNKTASDMIAGITGGIYSSMSVDENLNIFMNTRTKLVPVDQVSSGTMDQIYLALRLAAARLIQGGEDRMPLVFDDSFVLYDDERLRTALQWLSESYEGQIIIFTCHQRESTVMDSYGIPYHLITL